MSVALLQTQLVPDLLLSVREEGAAVAREGSKSKVKVGKKGHVAFELCSVVDEGVADALKGCLMNGELVVELPAEVRNNSYNILLFLDRIGDISIIKTSLRLLES